MWRHDNAGAKKRLHCAAGSGYSARMSNGIRAASTMPSRARGVVEECAGVITNLEVLELLRQQAADRAAEETRAPLAGASRLQRIRHGTRAHSAAQASRPAAHQP